MARKAGESTGRKSGSGRCVTEILARTREERGPHRRAFPPDFSHGSVEVGEVYGVFPKRWLDRALFVVDEEVATVGYFDDYFLVVEQLDTAGEDCKRWRELRRIRDRLVVLSSGSNVEFDGAISVEIGRHRLHQLERKVLGIERDGLIGDVRIEQGCRRGETDLLSLIGLVCRLNEF